jgi:hypothetical protein
MDLPLFLVICLPQAVNNISKGSWQFFSGLQILLEPWVDIFPVAHIEGVSRWSLVKYQVVSNKKPGFRPAPL